MADPVRPSRKTPHSGLCGTCRHASAIESDRGSIFIRCELSRVDASFAKYPGLPVLACRGYESKEDNDSKESPR
jgi:hypothetical protein